MNIPQVAHLVACKVSGLPGHHNWSRYAPGPTSSANTVRCCSDVANFPFFKLCTASIEFNGI